MMLVNCRIISSHRFESEIGSGLNMIDNATEAGQYFE